MIFNKVIMFFRLIILNIIYIIRNLFYLNKLSNIGCHYIKDIAVVSCNYSLFWHVIKISKSPLISHKFNIFNKLLLFLLGNKICFVVLDRLNNYRPIGYSFYYFNKRDILEKTIHRGYIGILPEYHGKGIGSQFDRIIIDHFARNSDLKGISSRVSINNIASYTMHIRSGFVPVERYFDTHLKEEREYMICDLDKFRN